MKRTFLLLSMVLCLSGYKKKEPQVRRQKVPASRRALVMKRKAPEKRVVKRRRVVRRRPVPRRRRVVKRRAGEKMKIKGLRGAYASWIPPGNFMMGSPKSEKKRYSNEGPQHRVRISRGFWMMRTEITQRQYRSLMGKNPSHFKNCGGRCPVEEINWHDALRFANALSRKEGRTRCFVCSGGKCRAKSRYRGSNYLRCKGWRLPTEAEWEYAARAGTKTPFYTGRCLSTEQANYDGNYPYKGCPKGKYRRTTVKVGSFRPNAWGLYDMSGNVYEWTWDWYGDYSSSAVVDPVGASSGSRRVHRGGSWGGNAWYARSASRHWYSPGVRSVTLGARLVVGP